MYEWGEGNFVKFIVFWEECVNFCHVVGWFVSSG
ncbi:MAG: hypothetical protein Hyperionvirus44_3 [Hyperionvirus sp.]|uniref:Uncharacterized protein n=1 Tax=Hyperionvirus sp. TaxID=2487770 RepID=A0A3G5AC83_9VIRU|nr:MAG: hypothetical protein Hyperionvirus44_3 [Hyperionvirus sp.]